MKLLLLAMTAILLASAFAVQVRAEGSFPVVREHKPTRPLQGFVPPDPHGSPPGESATSPSLSSRREPSPGTSTTASGTMLLRNSAMESPFPHTSR